MNRYSINETVNRQMYNDFDKSKLHTAFKILVKNYILDPNDRQTVFTKIDPEIAQKLIDSKRPLKTFNSRIGKGFKGFITLTIYKDIYYFNVNEDGMVNIVNLENGVEYSPWKLADCKSTFTSVLYGITNSPEATQKLKKISKTRYNRSHQEEKPSLQDRLRKYKALKSAKLFIQLGVDFFEEIKNSITRENIFGLFDNGVRIHALKSFSNNLIMYYKNPEIYNYCSANELFSFSESIYTYMNIIGGLTLDDLINIKDNKYTCYMEVEEDDVINESKSDPKLKRILRRNKIYSFLYQNNIDPDSCKFKLIDFPVVNNFNRFRNPNTLKKLFNKYDILIICYTKYRNNLYKDIVTKDSLNTCNYPRTGYDRIDEILEIIGVNTGNINIEDKKAERLAKKLSNFDSMIDLIKKEFDNIINAIKNGFKTDIIKNIDNMVKIYNKDIKPLKSHILSDSRD